MKQVYTVQLLLDSSITTTSALLSCVPPMEYIQVNLFRWLDLGLWLLQYIAVEYMLHPDVVRAIMHAMTPHSNSPGTILWGQGPTTMLPVPFRDAIIDITYRKCASCTVCTLYTYIHANAHPPHNFNDCVYALMLTKHHNDCSDIEKWMLWMHILCNTITDQVVNRIEQHRDNISAVGKVITREKQTKT